MQVRMHCVQVIIGSNLSINYRLTLPIKKDHMFLFNGNPAIQSFIKRGKICYHYVFENTNRFEVLRVMTAVQSTVNEQKIKELQQRQEQLLTNLSTIATTFA